MRHTSKLPRAAKYVFLCACICLGAAHAAKSALCATSEKTPDHDGDLKFSLAISGGVSLGSYEAGLNWAFIKHLKKKAESPSLERLSALQHERRKPWLVSVAGASAGSINTLMTALTWCVDENLLSQSTLTIKNTIANNLFRATWENIGIEKLLPTESAKYKTDDLLFSRESFSATLNDMRSLMEAGVFGDCDIPFAFTVTRVEPEPISIDGVDVVNSRFVIPMRLMSDPVNTHHVIITADAKVSEDPFWGNMILLPKRRDQPALNDETRYVVDTEEVLSAIQASSAFPLAFGSKTLTYCLPWNRLDRGKESDRCPKNFYIQENIPFIDGGIFDNVPLGIAKALAEPKTDPAENAKGRRIIYVNLTPDARRQLSTAQTRSQEVGQTRAKSFDQSMPLWTELNFLSGAIETSENYELYNVLRSGDWNHRMSRFVTYLAYVLHVRRSDLAQSPTVSCPDFIRHLDKDFNKQDSAAKEVVRCLQQEAARLNEAYLFVDAGDSTSIRKNFATWLTVVAAKLKDEGKLVPQITNALGDPGGERTILLSSRFSPITGAYLSHFGAFLERSFRTFDYYAGVYDAVNNIAEFRCSSDPDREGCPGREAKGIYEELDIQNDRTGKIVFASLANAEHGKQSAWAWALEFGNVENETSVRQVISVKDALLLHDPLISEPAFTTFIKNLAALSYPGGGDVLRGMLARQDRDPLNWYYPITSRTSVRLKQLADKEADKEHMPLARAVSIGMLTANTIIQDEKKVEVARPTLPPPAGWWWSVIPYELSADQRNGGWLLSWEPRVNFSESVSLNVKATPWIEDHFGDFYRRFFQVDLFVTWKKFPWFFSSIGLGPSYYEAWQDYYQPKRSIDHVGGAIHFGLLGDKLRITFGYRSINDSYFPATGDNKYLTIGITDLPGIIYWMTSGK